MHPSLDFPKSHPVLGAFCMLIGATASLWSGFHPDSNGQTERINQDLETTLRCMAANNPTSWATYFMRVEYAHSSLRSSATGLSRFECQFEYIPSMRYRLAFPLPGVWTNAVGRPGRRLCVSFFRPPRDTNVRLVTAAGQHLIFEPVKESS